MIAPSRPSFRTLVVVLMLVSVLTSCSDSEFVERITFVNDSEYPAHVETRGADRAEWLGLTVVPPNETRSVDRVLDQGDVWIFEFDYAGEDAVSVEISRADLEEAGWRVEVPEAFAAGLESRGVPPPPP